MSLGPPFDDSGRALKEAIGAAVVLLLGAAVAWVLIMSGRTVGDGLTVRVQLESTGPLRVGAKVRLAGREVGEIRGAIHQALPGGGRGVELQAFVLDRWAEQLRSNSQLFVATPSVLGEAYLEIGPPSQGAAPGPPARAGELLRGADPPQIDRFLEHLEANLREILSLMRENGPELSELIAASDSLLDTLSGLPTEPGQLARLSAQARTALETGQALLAAVREAGDLARVRQLAGELRALGARLGPELEVLGHRVEAVMARVDALSTLFTKERRAQLSGALGSLGQAAVLGQGIAAQVQALAARVERGEGTVGALLLHDRELYDDLHETHRILKTYPLRFMWKTKDGK